jgi:hypothetical protein
LTGRAVHSAHIKFFVATKQSRNAQLAPRTITQKGRLTACEIDEPVIVLWGAGVQPASSCEPEGDFHIANLPLENAIWLRLI